MTKQLQWAIGGLALLIVGFVALQIYLHVNMNQFKEELADPEPKTETETEQPPDQVQVPEVDNRPLPPDDGRKYEWHGDHWHEVPIAQKEPTRLPEGSLTFHEELLKTNPVKALRLQAEERGYVNAKWIPPFPPDDTEAQEFARAKYLCYYYADGTPEFEKAARYYFDLWDEIDEKYRAGTMSLARSLDLSKIGWVGVRTQQTHYDPESGYALWRSEYFPMHISDWDPDWDSYFK